MEDIGAQPFNTPVIMISDVSQCLTSLSGDFAKTIPFKEVEFEGLPLFHGHFPSQPIQQGSTCNLVDRYLLPGRWRPLFIKVLNAVVMTYFQISSAVDGSLVGHLNDPRYARTFPCVKNPGLLEEEEKKFLEKILSLAFIPEDAACNAENDARVSSEKDG